MSYSIHKPHNLQSQPTTIFASLSLSAKLQPFKRDLDSFLQALASLLFSLSTCFFPFMSSVIDISQLHLLLLCFFSPSFFSFLCCSNLKEKKERRDLLPAFFTEFIVSSTDFVLLCFPFPCFLFSSCIYASLNIKEAAEAT